MRNFIGAALAACCLLAALPTLAQFIPPPPELEGRIPQPLPPPPEPPIINGGPQGQGPPAGVIKQRRIDSAGAAGGRCLQEGACPGRRRGEPPAHNRARANGE